MREPEERQSLCELTQWCVDRLRKQFGDINSPLSPELGLFTLDDSTVWEWDIHNPRFGLPRADEPLLVIGATK